MKEPPQESGSSNSMSKFTVFIFTLLLNNQFSNACVNNKYNFQQNQNIATCVVWGNYHVKTFDDHGINFKSDCGFRMVSFMVGAAEFKIDVTRWNNVCKINKAGCAPSVQILYDGVDHTLDLDDASLVRFTRNKKQQQLPMEIPELRVHQPGKRIIVEFVKIGVSVKWDMKNIIEISIERNRGYEVLGLCGNMDKCSSNDLMLVNRIIAKELGDFLKEWQIDKPTCPDIIKTNSPCQNKFKTDLAMKGCKTVKMHPFTEARKVLDPEIYFDACVWDYCSCRMEKTEDCLCDSYDVYAKTSVSAGAKPSRWRTDQLCPFKCDAGLFYYPCGPEGGVKTCGSDDENAVGNNPASCEEGCYCPPLNYVFHNKCYLKKRCPCTHNGRTIQPGQTVTQDCHTCSCVNGQIECPKEPVCKVTAVATGDPHYTTWDGKRFDFMGKCTYYLIKGGDFSIEADHEVYYRGKFQKADLKMPSYMRKIIIRMAGEVIQLIPGPEAVVNNVTLKRFPHKAGPIIITKPSANNILVELPNLIDVQWNGYSTGTFRLPTTMEGQVFGLLGTYTGDQSDDFMTPEGVIVNDAVTFGNSWKTEYSCMDEPEAPVQHPCDVNPDAKPAAEQICSVIKGDLFKKCNIEDPQSSYEDCVYDTCFCRDDPNKCSCDQIAVVADSCGTKGIVVNWRNKIQQCRMKCPAGQVYQECGDICARSCEDLSMRPNCVKACIEGCNCAPGTTMDENGRCIPIAQCKCRIGDVVYQPGFQYLDKEGKELYTCTDARWVTSIPTDKEQQDTPYLTQLDEKCDPENFSVYTPCKYPTPKTCQNMHTFEITSIEHCDEGCECKQGFVFDLFTESCVRPEECPCYNLGKSYDVGAATVQEGCNRCVCSNDGMWNCKEEECAKLCIDEEVQQKNCNICRCKNAFWECSQRDCSQKCDEEGESKQIDCNTCVCVDGFWNCTQRTCASECQENDVKYEGCQTCTCIAGNWKCNEDNCLSPACERENDVKIQDYGYCICKNKMWKCAKGQCDIWGDSHVKTFDGLRYDFQGECSYILAEGKLGSDRFAVIFTTERCSHAGATCLKTVTINIDKDGIHESFTLVKNGNVPKTDNLKQIVLTDHFLFVTVNIIKTGIQLFWDKKTWVYVKLADHWQGRVEGLCGNYNRIKDDDTQLYDTRSNDKGILPFVDLWRTNVDCELAKPNINTCDKLRRNWAVQQCNVLLAEVFSSCHASVPVNDYYEACVTDSCKCDLGGDCECLCTAISAYAQQCSNYGIPIKWRSQNLCPIQCAGNTQYQACVTACPQKTCETIRRNITNTCDSDQEEICREGCAPKPIPPGHVYTNNNYEKYVKEEKCVESMCGVFYDGEVTLTDECHVCVCKAGREECVDLPCSTVATLTPQSQKDSPQDNKTITRTPKNYEPGSTTNTPYPATTRQPNNYEPGSTTSTPYPVTPEIQTPSTVVFSSAVTTTTANPAPVCDKSKCAQINCPKTITKEVQIEGQCCKSCQHETKCVVNLQYSKRFVLKKPGQIWMDGPCKECTCVGEESFNHCTVCRNKICAPVKTRNVTIGNIYYEFGSGPCCSTMEPVACVHGNKIYRVGELWDLNECVSMKCVKNPATNLTVTIEISELCHENCPPGFVYKKPKNSCCGHCVQDSCIFDNLPKKLGDKWYSENGCTAYTCESLKGEYKVFARKTICPPLEKCPGKLRQGRCCKYCDTYELFSWQDEPLTCNFNDVPPAT